MSDVVLSQAVQAHRQRMLALGRIAVLSDVRLRIPALASRASASAADLLAEADRADAFGAREYAGLVRQEAVAAQLAVLRDHPWPTGDELVDRAPPDPSDEPSWADEQFLANLTNLVATGASRAAAARTEDALLRAAAEPEKHRGLLKAIRSWAGEVALPDAGAEASLRLLGVQADGLLFTARDAARIHAEAELAVAKFKARRVEEAVQEFGRWDHPANIDHRTRFLDLEPTFAAPTPVPD